MKESTKRILTELIEKYPPLSQCECSIEGAYKVLENTYKTDGKVLACGNGGSAADCEHIVGELMKGFRLSRKLSCNDIEAFSAFENGENIGSGLQKALPAISLVSHSGLMTAFLNDCDPDLVFAQQVYGYMKPCDTLIALTTSGNSVNIVNAAITAKAMGGKCISITGESGGKISNIADVTIKLPSNITAGIQEYTLPVYHCICAMLEEEFFGC